MVSRLSSFLLLWCSLCLAAPMVLFDESPPAAAVTADAKRVTGIKLETVGAEAGATPAAGQGMLRLSGACTAGDGPSYAYVTVWTGEQRVTPKTRLSYCVFARPESVSHNFALDLATPNFYPDNLRDKPDAVDQRGVRAHPALGYQGGRNVGQWSYREISLAPLPGRKSPPRMQRGTAAAARQAGSSSGTSTRRSCGNSTTQQRRSGRRR